MSFLLLCLLSWLVVFIGWAAFLWGVEFGRAGLPDGVDLTRATTRAAAFSVLACSPVLLIFALMMIWGNGL